MLPYTEAYLCYSTSVYDSGTGGVAAAILIFR
jgi:hypothetical protein